MRGTVKTMPEYESWDIVRKIGSGSYGTVYEIERKDVNNFVYKSALKVISVPQSESEILNLQSSGDMNKEKLAEHFQDEVSDIIKEFELMYQLRGNTNIVGYEDHKAVKHADGIGWDVMIRMELLTSLDRYIVENQMTRRDVIRLGIDMCQALDRCQKYNIIHRDIKPANIFVSEQGDFKLGDFGIARTIEKHTDAMFELSHKGTYNYMAPEIYNSQNYEYSVDIYSLGIVMYYLLNQNRLPFMPPYPQVPTAEDYAQAMVRRMRGDILPYPSQDHTKLADIVLRACSFQPEHRYSNPAAMQNALQAVLQEKDYSEDTFDCDVTMVDCSNELGSENLLHSSGASVFVSDLLSNGTIMMRQNGNSSNLSPQNINRSLKSMKGGLFIKGIIAVIAILAAIIFLIISFIVQDSKPDIQALINQQDFAYAYQMLSEAKEAGDNVDPVIHIFVRACEQENESKRAAAAMKLLSDDIQRNAEFYKETIDWMYEHEKDDQAKQILNDLKSRGEEGGILAKEIELQHDEKTTGK